MWESKGSEWYGRCCFYSYVEFMSDQYVVLGDVLWPLPSESLFLAFASFNVEVRVWRSLDSERKLLYSQVWCTFASFWVVGVSLNISKKESKQGVSVRTLDGWYTRLHKEYVGCTRLCCDDVSNWIAAFAHLYLTRDHIQDYRWFHSFSWISSI